MKTALSLTLAEIAALAGVRRPVVSVWRSRFSEGPQAFPAPTAILAGSPRFDAAEVAAWLRDTGHGNNPEPVADAPVFASAPQHITRDDAPVLEALAALRSADGSALVGGRPLTARAADVDPDDLALAHEIVSVPADSPLPAYVDAVADASYSPAAAWESLQARIAVDASQGPAGPLSPVGRHALGALALALTAPGQVVLADAGGILSSTDLFEAAVAALADDADPVLHVPADQSSRSIRRFLRVHELAHAVSSTAPHADEPAVVIARLRGHAAADELAALEELVVELSDAQRALVIGPTTLLADPLEGRAAVSRDAVLRSGRVRGIARLPSGLVPTAPRQTLAAWVIGGPQGGVPLADRFTVIGDLEGPPFSVARQQDLVSDVLAALGTAREAVAHAFRFVRFVRTSTLLASDESLVAGSFVARPAGKDASELPALVDETLARLDPPIDLAVTPVQTGSAPAPTPAILGDAIDAGDARLIRGTRLDPAHTQADEGFPVLGRDEVHAGSASARRIDQVRTAVEYPRAELTRPGDVVFVSGSHPAAMVDVDGSSVVEYPARILRVIGRTLVPELIAADINALPAPLPWRRWPLRRIDAAQNDGLRATMARLRTARAAAEQRLADLQELEALVLSAVSTGVLSTAESPTTEGTD